MNCNLCGADETELLFPSTLERRDAPSTAAQFACTSDEYGVHPPIVRCRQCKLIYANPRPSAEQLVDSYTKVVDTAYLKEREGRELTFRRHLDHLGARVVLDGKKRLLDIGCYIGIFLEQAERRGWEAWGVEPSHWAVEWAQERNLRVIQGTLKEASFPNEYFDLVTLWDVIEHLADPLSELRRIAGVVRPGGWVCIHTMDVGSPFAQVMGKRWPWLMEMHLYYFSRATLTAMLHRAGFRVVETSTRGRVLRLGYVISRLVPYSAALAVAIGSAIRTLGLAERPIPVNFGDLFTAYARKEPQAGQSSKAGVDI